ncbi:MAG: hypothetical protein J0M12_17775 [Deltaproteobacteria bacterium]|nr:hypothetical protein [Deltaproteobacteria bacterium]
MSCNSNDCGGGASQPTQITTAAIQNGQNGGGPPVASIPGSNGGTHK